MKFALLISEDLVQVYLFKTWYSFSPQLERCGDQRKVASYL